MLQQLLRLQYGARACKCIPCLTRSAIATSIATPGITTKSSGRHTILFYSTIISTAAAADVTIKQNRRAEWDRKIGELEQSLHTEHEDTESANDSHTSLQPDVRSWSITRSNLPKYIKPNNPDSHSSQLDLFMELVKEGEDSSQARGAIHLPTRSNTSPSSIYASDRIKLLRRDWTPKKALTAEYAIAKLVSRIMLSASDLKPYRKAPLMNTIEDMQSKLEILKDLGPFNVGHLERPSYPQYDLASQTIEEGSRKLNQVLGRLFRKFRDQTLSVTQMLNKVAYNLLVSPIAPDIITLSILISQFSNLRGPHQADMAIEAFEEIHLRQDQMSVDTILTHYIRHQNLAGFHRYVLKVQGYHGGLQLADPQTIIDKTNSGKLRWWKDKLIESIDLDPRLYNTIASGYHKFSYFGSAEQWSNAMSCRNIPQDLPVLLGPLARCAHSHNWDDGLLIWRHIEALLWNPETASQVRRTDLMGAYHLALKLCRNTAHNDWFKSIYSDALRQGFGIDELFLNIDIMPLPVIQAEILKKRRRMVSMLLHRVETIQQDMKELAVQMLAHKVMCAGLSLEAIKQVFSDRGLERLYAAWVAERTWLLEAKTWENPLPRALSRVQTANSTVMELKSSGVVNQKFRELERNLRPGSKHVFSAHSDDLTTQQTRKLIRFSLHGGWSRKVRPSRNAAPVREVGSAALVEVTHNTSTSPHGHRPAINPKSSRTSPNELLSKYALPEHLMRKKGASSSKASAKSDHDSYPGGDYSTKSLVIT